MLERPVTLGRNLMETIHTRLSALLEVLPPRRSGASAGRSDGRFGDESPPFKTPLPRPVIDRTATELAPLLEESDHTLHELLDGVQAYVDHYDYPDREGNEFFERLVDKSADSDSLVEIIAVRDDLVWFICPAELWAEMTHDLGYTADEGVAVADAHQTYANQAGLAAYGANVRVMCVTVRDRRLRDLIERTRMTPQLDA